jgi:hypothetical protein
VIYTHLAAALVAMAIGAAGAWKIQAWRWTAADAERIQSEQDDARLKSTALARGAERNDRETTDQLRRATFAAAAARNELERLRNAANGVAAGADPGAASCPDDGRLSRLASLLTEGAGLAEEGGRRVEHLAAEKAGLQRDATEVRRVLVGP